MIFNIHQLRLAAALTLALPMVACVNIAKLENLPPTASQVSFDEIAARAVRVDGIWNLQTDYEHLLEAPATSFDSLHKNIEEAVKVTGYEIVKSDPRGAVVLGQRGIRLNEWNAVVGVYYRRKDATVQIYLKSEITQDITGGWRSNRAKEVGDALCSRVPGCRVQR